MSEFSTSTPRTSGQGAFGAPERVAGSTMSGAGPVRPEEGSPLALLLGRQATLSGPARLLGFVPAQVR